LFKKLMAKQGAIVTEFPAAERRKWAAAMPNIAKEWVDAQEAKGVPARQVMKTFMNSARAAGAKPLRNWDEGL